MIMQKRIIIQREQTHRHHRHYYFHCHLNSSYFQKTQWLPSNIPQRHQFPCIIFIYLLGVVVSHDTQPSKKKKKGIQKQK